MSFGSSSFLALRSKATVRQFASSDVGPLWRMLLGIALVAIAPATSSLGAIATAEVTKSGRSYVVKVDGTQTYSGTNYADALQNAAGIGERIMNVRVGGTISKTVRLRWNTTFNYFPTSERIILKVNGPGIYSYKSTGIVLDGLRIGGSAWYGIRLSSCNGAVITDLDMDFGGADVGVGLRVDNEGSTRVTGLTISNVRVANMKAGGDRQGVETFGVDNYDIDGIDAYNVGGCGLLINDSNNGTIGSVYGELCGNGTTYAALRFANGCDGATVDYLEAIDCGRGLFILDSDNIRVAEVSIANCVESTIWISNGSNNDVMSGTVLGLEPAITNSPGSSINVVWIP